MMVCFKDLFVQNTGLLWSQERGRRQAMMQVGSWVWWLVTVDILSWWLLCSQ